VLTSEEIITEILNIFQTGAKTELLLNVLIYTDFLRWRHVQLACLIKEFSDIIKQRQDENRMMLCYNPILSIALTCEFLDKISSKVHRFSHECGIIKKRLLKLGGVITSYLDDDKITKVFLDTDFRDRTLLKLVTYNKYEDIFGSYKVNRLLDEIWVGKNTFDCDGTLEDFSILTFLLG
jgi:hypothetical protein